MTSAQPPDEVRASPKHNAGVRQHRPAVIANSEKHTILRCACVCLFVQNYSYDCPTGLYSALKPYMVENTNTVTDQRTTDASAAASDSNSEAFLRSLRPGDSVSAPIFLQQSSEQSDSADGFLPAPGSAGSVAAAGGSTAARTRNEPGESAASALFASFWQTDAGGASGAIKQTPEHSGGDLAAGPSSSSYDVSYNLLYSFYSIPNMVLPLFSGFLLNTEGSSSTSLRPLIMFLRYASLWLTAAATLIYYAVWLKSWTGMWLGRLLFGIASEISFVAWNVLIMAVFTARGGTARCANKSSTSASAPADEAPPSSTSSMGPTFAMACVCCVSRLGTSASCFVGPWLCALALEPSLVFAIGAGFSACGTLFAWTQLPAGAFASTSRESNNSTRTSDAPNFQRIAQCHRSNFAQHCAADAHWFCRRNGRRSSSKAGAGRSIAIRGSSKNPAMRGDNSTKISSTTTPRSSTKGGGLVINVESPTFDATDVGGEKNVLAASAAENLGADGLGRLEDGGFTTSSDASSDSGEEVDEGNMESHLHQDNLHMNVHSGINIDETETGSAFSPIKARKGSKNFSSRRTPSRGSNRNRVEEPARRQHRLKSSRAATACRNDLKLLGRNVARLPHEFWVFAVVCVSLSGAIFPFNNVAQDVIAKIFYRDAEADASVVAPESPASRRSRSASAGAAPASESFEARITELLAATAPPSRTSGGSRTNAAMIPAEEGTGSGISSEHSAMTVFPSEQSEGQHLSGNAKAGRDLALIFLVSGLLTPLAGRIVDKSGGKHTLVLFLCCAVVAVVHLGLILETMAGRASDFRDGKAKSTASMENANGPPAASFDSASGSSSSSWFFGGDSDFFPFLSWLPLPSAWTAWLWLQHFATCSLLVCGQTMFGAVLWPSVATVLGSDAESTSDLLSTAYGVATALQNTALVVVPIAVGKLMTGEDDSHFSRDAGASEALAAAATAAKKLEPEYLKVAKMHHGRGDLETAHLYHSAEFLFLFLTTVALIASLFLVPASDFVLLREAIKHWSQRALLYLHFWRTRFGVVGGCGKMKQGVSCFGVQILGAGGPLSFVAGSRGGGGKVDEDLDPENFTSPPSISPGADELEDIYSASWL